MDKYTIIIPFRLNGQWNTIGEIELSNQQAIHLLFTEKIKRYSPPKPTDKLTNEKKRGKT